MTPAHAARTLSKIATLTAGEIDGWRKAQAEEDPRAPVDGESAALAAREKVVRGGRKA